MKMFIQCIVAFAVLAVVACEESPETMKIIKDCQKKTGASEEDIKTMLSMNSVPTKRIQYCLMACYHKGTGAMDASNKYILSKTLEEVEPLKKTDALLFNKVTVAVKECTSKVMPDKDECNVAKNMMECIERSLKSQ